MRRLLLLFLLPFVSVSSEAKVLTAGYGTSESLEVFSGTQLAEPFVVIGKVQAVSYVHDDLIKQIRKLALKYGGQAVIGYTVERSQNSGPLGSNTVSVGEYQATGIIIRYDAAGEKKVSATESLKILN